MGEICHICLNTPINPVSCNDCKNKFCAKCVLKWYNINNICPLRCSSPWNINLEDLKIYENEGFIICKMCDRIGSLRCDECGVILEFELKG